MKQLITFLLASSLVAETYLTDCTQTAVFLASPCLSWNFDLNLLYLQPNSDLSFCTELGSSQWKLHDINPHYSLGYEFGAGAFLQERSAKVCLNYIHYHSHHHDNKKGIIIDNNTLYTHAKGHASHLFDAGNLNFGMLINFGCCLKTELFGGVGLVRLEQKRKTFFFYPSTSKTLRTSSLFFGVGPQMGFNFSYGLCEGFQIVGKGTGTLFLGKVKSHTHAIQIRHRQTIVPGFEGKAGLAYTFQLGDCICSLIGGYQILYYWNGIQIQRDPRHFSLNGPYSTFDVAF